MKKLLSIFLFLPALVFIAQAQKFSTDYGKIGGEEYEMTVYEKDKTAPAVVIFDIGKSSFIQEEGGFNILFERHKRVKVLSEAGIEYGNVEIPFYREGDIFEKIYDLEAITYNYEDGAITRTPLELNNWYDEKLNGNWYVRKFAFPNVKKGSVIEFKYKLTTEYIFNLRDWEFQSKIPTLYSEYEVRIIPFYQYTFLLQGANKFDDQKSYESKGMSRRYASLEFNDMVNHYIMKDIPAFKSEEFITSINDYIIKLDFQLSKIFYPSGVTKEIMTSWPNLIKELNKHADFGKFIDKAQKTSSKTIDIEKIKELPDDKKFEYILAYVKENYKWNEYNSEYASKSLNNLIKDKFGNCADLNLLTIGLLRGAGIDASPVIISTRSHGKVHADYPFAHFFNYVLIKANINGKNILTDATEPILSNYRIPSKCINDVGLVINESEEEEWIRLSSKIPSTKSSQFKIDFVEKKINVQVISHANEYFAFNLKQKIGNDKDNLLKYLQEIIYQEEKGNISIVELKNENQSLKYEYNLSMDPELINNKLYISPFLNNSLKNNPLNQDSRSYPIDMVYPTKQILRSIITVPEGYTIDYLPQPQKIKNDLFELEYSVVQSEHQIIISFLNYFKKSVYQANEYKNMKFYFDEIVKRGNEKVVLQKEELAPE